MNRAVGPAPIALSSEVSMIVPLRCSDCGTIIERKPKAKTPKYCPNCRQRRQDEWRNR